MPVWRQLKEALDATLLNTLPQLRNSTKNKNCYLVSMKDGEGLECLDVIFLKIYIGSKMCRKTSFKHGLQITKKD